jgi:methylthioribose-1-phosphate isomerase
MSFNTIQWKEDGIRILDQRLLPSAVRYVTLKDPAQVVDAIKTLAVRGAPAIGVAAAMGAALGARQIRATARRRFLSEFDDIVSLLAAARPTARNLFWALERMRRLAHGHKGDPPDIIRALETEALAIYEEDIRTNEAIGRHGQELLSDGDTVLTHCNAGALATAGYGTALGVIRAAVSSGKRISVIADETRPLLQGSRLTVWELMADGIDVTLITDGMAGYCFKEGLIDKVITGADRIAANGDTANKIGTYTVSILAKEHGVPFYIAAPCSTIDPETKTGADIPIEERDPDEVRLFMGVQSAPPGAAVRNPAFDVTPAVYIGAIITERGVIRPPYAVSIREIIGTGEIPSCGPIGEP